MKKRIKEGYLRFNDWCLRFFLRDHILITSALIGVGIGSILGETINFIIRGLASLRKSS